MARKSSARKPNPREAAFDKGLMLARKTIVSFILSGLDLEQIRESPNSRDWSIRVWRNGVAHANMKADHTPEEWCYLIAHVCLHLAFDHFTPRTEPAAWEQACEAVVGRFLEDVKIGRPPSHLALVEWPTGDEDTMLRRIKADQLVGISALNPRSPDLMLDEPPRKVWQAKTPAEWAELLAHGIRGRLAAAIEEAGGVSSDSLRRDDTRANRAMKWFMTSYPLLGALAASFEVIEDRQVCYTHHIGVAAVCPATREVYVNPDASLNEQETAFVMAHELLHVGLQHSERRQGRDPFLWNVACDYVINGWLVEMGVGQVPQLGLLYDPELKGKGAEEIYDQIVTDLRSARKLTTFRGRGSCDVLDEGHFGRAGADLDAFYRRCLAQGLDLWQNAGRGLLPGGLVEEIRALDRPPIPWDVRLAQWFDARFSPLEHRRTYARPSRRQASTPDIPRPRVAPLETAEAGQTFGVVLDTSGSMDRALLSAALGSISSYAIARGVERVRLVFCDAVAYDAGWISALDIAGRVKVRGRGGTILQPGVDLLLRSKDFPETGPILVITDGECDVVRVPRDHAWLVPEGRALPFRTVGPVFWLK